MKETAVGFLQCSNVPFLGLVAGYMGVLMLSVRSGPTVYAYFSVCMSDFSKICKPQDLR